MKFSSNRHFTIFGFLSGLAACAALIAPQVCLGADTNSTPAERLEAMRSEIALTRTNIVLTLEQLDLLRKSDDPHAQEQRFVDQLAVMKERAKLTQDRVKLMTARGDAYFADWETRNEAITDPEEKKQAEAVRAQRMKSYALIKINLQQAGKNFIPLQAELDDIKTLLAGDRSKEKVAEAKTLFSDANWHCVSVQRALMNVELQLDALAATPEAKKPDSQK